jgi:hypothetical protein
MGKALLADTAYFCLTLLEHVGDPAPTRSKNRQDAADFYIVEHAVLSKLGELSTVAGGESARKAEGSGREHNAREKQWLEDVLSRLIIRASEVAKSRSSLPLIRMTDFVALS